MVGYGSIEVCLSQHMLFFYLSAVLQPRRWPDEAQIEHSQAHVRATYRTQRSAYRNQQLLVAHYSRPWKKREMYATTHALFMNISGATAS